MGKLDASEPVNDFYNKLLSSVVETIKDDLQTTRTTDAPRKRGRPSTLKTDAASLAPQIETSASIPDESAPPSRKRGRPSKPKTDAPFLAPQVETSTSIGDEIAPPPRKRQTIETED